MSSQQQYHLSQVLDPEEQARLWEMAVLNLGSAAIDAWRDTKTTDFYLYSTGTRAGTQRLGVRRAGTLETVSEITSVNARAAFNLIASYAGVTVNEQEPEAETTLLDETRVQFMHPPLCPAPKFTFRKSQLRVSTFDSLRDTTAYDEEKLAFLNHCVDERKTVFFVGATGSGKTTGGKAFLHAQKRWEHKRRYIVIQDRNEIRPPLETVEYYFVTKKKSGHPGYTGSKLLKLALSDDPDIIIYGELRDGKTAAQHKAALNTGHEGGLTTFHANGYRDAFYRYGDWLRERRTEVIPAQLVRLIPAVVFCYIDEASNEYRTEVARTIAYDEGEFRFELIGKAV